MVNILITGANSYIGTSVEKWLNRWTNEYKIDTLDMKDDSWRNKSFSKYDVVYHVAGIAHVNAEPKMESLYYKVNRDLTIETAKKAKMEGVKQFIFMSSMIVYGESNEKHPSVLMTKSTIPTPYGFYGNSKLQAEKGILELQEEDFNVAIIRPPMIYGKGNKGNYEKLSRVGKKFLVFPELDNKRSMLYIENLCEFIKLMIDNNEKGIFHPQNKEYANTTEMVKIIAEVHGKKIITTKLFNPIIRLLGKKYGVVNKAFGNYICEQELSNYMDWKYCIFGFEESIRKTES